MQIGRNNILNNTVTGNGIQCSWVHLLFLVTGFVLLMGCVPAAWAWRPVAGTADETAQRMSTAFATPANSCGDPNEPLFWCSGVLLRPVTQQVMHSGMLTEPAYYLRADLPLPWATRPDTAGLVFLPNYAVPNRTFTQPYCALVGNPKDLNRTAHGCWPASSIDRSKATDQSSCAELIGQTVTVDNWVAWRKQHSVACSFSTHSFDDFVTAMKAARQEKHRIYLPMMSWSFPVMGFDRPTIKAGAIAYAVDSAAGRQVALTVQQFLAQHGVHLPLLAFRSGTFTAVHGKTAQQIVDELNIRFNNKAASCTDANGKTLPAYYCSGLIARTTSYLTVRPGKNMVSHYFLRTDTQTRQVYSAGSPSFGFILKPSTALAKRMKCIYPWDANTAHGEGGAVPRRSERYWYCSDHENVGRDSDASSCGKDLNRSGDRAQDWRDAFLKKYPTRKNNGLTQCSFSVQSAAQFYASILVTGQTASKSQVPWNEVILQAWQDTDIPEIEAIFFLKGASEGVNGAKVLAAKYAHYLKERGEHSSIIPLVELDLYQDMNPLKLVAP